MIFEQSLQRELSRTFTATVVVLVTIVMTMMLIRTLGLASKGSVNPQEVFLVMTYSVMGHLPTILTLSLFITLVSTLSRIMRDSEMIIWLTSGQSVLSFLRPLFSFSTPILITIAVMALLVWPWTNGQMQDLRDRFEMRGDLERVTPGQFQESSNGKRVFYIDKDGSVTGSKNIFIASFEANKQIITSARNGRIEVRGADKYLILDQGQRLELDPIRESIKLTEFQQMGTSIGGSHLDAQLQQPKALPSLTLLQNPKPEHLGELAWRLSLALAAINFVVLALALSNHNPRTGRGGHLMFALLTFVIYYNLINAAQVWIGSGRMGMLTALIALHGAALAIGMIWLARRQLRP